MSYILQALKKSQQDRELGKVPTLTAPSPDAVVPISPRSVSPWSFGALILALTAVLIALYGTFGERLGDSGDQVPSVPDSELGPRLGQESRQESGDSDGLGSDIAYKAAASNPPPPTDTEARPPADSREQRTVSASVSKEDVDDSPSGSLGGNSRKSKEADGKDEPEAQTMERIAEKKAKETAPALRPEKTVAPGADALASRTRRSHPPKENTPRLQEAIRSAEQLEAHPETEKLLARIPASQREFLESEAERLRKRLAALDTNPGPSAPGGKDSPMPEKTAPPSVRNAPRDALKAPKILPMASTKSSTRDAAISETPAPPPRPPLERELPRKIHRALPDRQIIAHIYAKEPERRFIILNSTKLREGEETSDGLTLQEVRPDGVIFQFKNHRFFQPR